MSRMTVRIYKRHDLDLMYLFFVESEGFNFQESLKIVLKDYIKGKRSKLSVPEGMCPAVDELPPHKQLHINLDAKADKDIINWKKSITKGRQNNLVKNIYRNAFPPIEIPYKSESEHYKINYKKEK